MPHTCLHRRLLFERTAPAHILFVSVGKATKPPFSESFPLLHNLFIYFVLSIFSIFVSMPYIIVHYLFPKTLNSFYYSLLFFLNTLYQKVFRFFVITQKPHSTITVGTCFLQYIISIICFFTLLFSDQFEVHSANFRRHFSFPDVV